MFVPREEEVGVECRDRVEVGLGGVLDVCAETAREEGGHKSLGCLCHDVVVEVLYFFKVMMGVCLTGRLGVSYLPARRRLFITHRQSLVNASDFAMYYTSPQLT